MTSPLLRLDNWLWERERTQGIYFAMRGRWSLAWMLRSTLFKWRLTTKRR